MYSRISRSLILIGSVAIAAACAAQTQQPAPASSAASPAASVKAGTSEAALFEASCSGCHELSQATDKQMDRAGWSDTIARMVGYGAPLTPAQSEQLATYLAATHGPVAAAK